MWSNERFSSIRKTICSMSVSAISISWPPRRKGRRQASPPWRRAATILALVRPARRDARHGGEASAGSRRAGVRHLELPGGVDGTGKRHRAVDPDFFVRRDDPQVLLAVRQDEDAALADPHVHARPGRRGIVGPLPRPPPQRLIVTRPPPDRREGGIHARREMAGGSHHQRELGPVRPPLGPELLGPHPLAMEIAAAGGTRLVDRASPGAPAVRAP